MLSIQAFGRRVAHCLEFVFIADEELPWLLYDTDQGKMYFCAYCNMKCVRHQDIRRHSRIHTGEKPYSCEVCGSFRRKQHLKGHYTRHTNK